MNTDQHPTYTFSRSFRGYAPAEVEAALRDVGERIASLARDNDALEAEAVRTRAIDEKVSRMLAAVEESAAAMLEQSRGQIAALVSRAEEERRLMIQNARDEAALVIRDAERRAEAAIADAEQRRASILEEIGLLHARRMALIARLRALFTSQAEFLASLEGVTADPSVAPAPLRRDARGDASVNGGLTAAQIRDIIGSIDTQEGTAHATASQHD